MKNTDGEKYNQSICELNEMVQKSIILSYALLYDDIFFYPNNYLYNAKISHQDMLTSAFTK